MPRTEPHARAFAVLGAIAFVLAAPAIAQARATHLHSGPAVARTDALLSHVAPKLAHAAPTPNPSATNGGSGGAGSGNGGGGGSGGAGQQTQAGGANDLVVLSGDVVIRKDETSGDVVVIHGSARVAGVVRGDVVVIDGPITVSGVVLGDVVALDGDVALLAGGHVTGDVTVANGTLAVQVGSAIDGKVHRGGLALLSPAKLVTKLAVWIAISVSTLLLGLALVLLGPRAGDAVAEAGSTSVGASIGWGAAAVLGLPAVAVLLLVSLVGLPFGLGLLLALALLYAVGYVYGAWWLGRLIVRPSRHGGARRLAAFLAGWAILRVVGFVPVLGGITWFLAAWYGLGAATVAMWRARHEPVPRVEPGRPEPGFATTPPDEPASAAGAVDVRPTAPGAELPLIGQPDVPPTGQPDGPPTGLPDVPPTGPPVVPPTAEPRH